MSRTPGTPVTRIHEVGERALIEQLRRVFARVDPRVVLGIGDDAAILSVHAPLCVTTDSIEAGVDWLIDRTPRDAIGHRAAAVNLSDLAAMGAEPLALTLALELPSTTPVADILTSARAMARLASEHNATVVGGDIGVGSTERWTVTAMGTLPAPPLLRSNARPGDTVWLIGEVGMAQIGLLALQEGRKTGVFAPFVQRHLRPEPLCALGVAVARQTPRASAIDLSDGLLTDARKLAAASGVRLELCVARPRWCSDALLADPLFATFDWRSAVAAGGDDYALLVTAESGVGIAGVPVGAVVEGEGVALEIDDAVYAGPAGWEHR